MMIKVVIGINMIISSIILLVLVTNGQFNNGDQNSEYIVYIISFVLLFIGLFLIYLWYRVYKLGNIKLRTDDINYSFGDEIKYEISVLIKENIPEQRNLYIQIFGINKVRRGDSTYYDRTMINSKKLDTLGNNFSEIKKDYSGTIEIPTLDKLMGNTKSDFNSGLKQSYQEYIKDNPELAGKISEQDYLAGSNMVINTIANFMGTDLSKPNYDFYELKVLLDDERGGLFEADLEETKKIYIN